MAMEVISITDAIVGGRRVDHCGVLLLLPNTVCMPQEGNRVLFYEMDEKDQVFYSQKKSCIGIVKFPNGSLNVVRTLIFHVATKDVDTTNENQMDYFLKFMGAPSMSIPKLESKTEFERFLLQKYEEVENIENLVEAFSNPRTFSLKKVKTEWKCCESDDTDSMSCLDRTYRHYLRPYSSFLQRNPVEKQEGKKILKSTKNVVKFVKSLGWENDTLLLECVSMFLMRHGCEHPDCDSFSYLKCGSCLSAHYCNEECQERDWDRHRHQCGHMRRDRDRELKVPEFIHSALEKYYDHKVMNFPAFFRNLQIRIYEACYNTLKTKEAQNFVQECLSSSNFCMKSKTKMLLLLKDENSKTLQLRKELMKQVGQAYGPFNKIFIILSS